MLADRIRARQMLAACKPLGEWIAERNPAPENIELARRIVAELMKEAALTPDEERLVKKVLEVDKAEAAMEANNVGA
jgi:hypothetical protein